MNAHHDNKTRRNTARAGRRWLIAAALAVAVGATGASFDNSGAGLPGHHGGAGPMAAQEPADQAVQRHGIGVARSLS